MDVLNESTKAAIEPTFKGKGPATTPPKVEGSLTPLKKKKRCIICKARSPYDLDGCFAVHRWKAPPGWKFHPAIDNNVEKARKDPQKRKLIEESEARQDEAKRAKLAEPPKPLKKSSGSQ